MADVTRHTDWKPGTHHAERHPDDADLGRQFFYFQAESSDGSLSGYLTRELFNSVAEKLGMRPLSDDEVTP